MYDVRMIQEFRDMQVRVREAVEEAFPNGARVWPIGVTTGNWGGTVQHLEGHERRATAAHMVFVHWDNGNKYCVALDEIERVKHSPSDAVSNQKGK